MTPCTIPLFLTKYPLENRLSLQIKAISESPHSRGLPDMQVVASLADVGDFIQSGLSKSSLPEVDSCRMQSP